jgi:hypothetical protein
VIVTKDEIRAIRNGELDELVLNVSKVPEVGSVQAVQSGVGKHSTCSVRILDTWPHVDGGHVVRIELSARHTVTRYLRPGRGTTTDPSRALKDPRPPRAFSPDEEPPTEGQLAEWTVPTGWKDPGIEAREIYRRDLEADALERRLAEVASPDDLAHLLEIAGERGVDIRSDVRVIQRRLEALQRQVEAVKDKIREGRQVAA